MTEAEFIAQEAAKCDARFRRALRKVNRTGEIGRDMAETLLIADYISFGPPRPGVSPYNCFRLTERGVAELARLES